MLKIISYDGDGGGLCAHLRHIYSDFRLSKILQIEHLIAYPPFYCIFQHEYPFFSDCTTINSIDVEYFSENCLTIDQILEYCELNRIKYILSGNHHYTTLYSNLSNPSVSERMSMHQYFSSFRLTNNILDILSYSLPYPFRSEEYCSFHIRTFYDSHEGNKMFKQSAYAIYSTMLSLAAQVKLSDYYIFSDSDNDAYFFAGKLRRLTCKNVQIVSTQKLHSSLVHLLGSQLLCKEVQGIKKLLLQANVPIAKVSNLLRPTLIDLLGLSLSKVSFTTCSSFGCIPAVLFPWSDQQDHSIVPYTYVTACNSNQPY